MRSTYTVYFIQQNEAPHYVQVAYATYVLDHRPLKEEQYQVRITVGDNMLIYPEDAGSLAENLPKTKVIVNSVIFDAKNGAQFMWVDIKYYYLAPPMDQSEYTTVQ